MLLTGNVIRELGYRPAQWWHEAITAAKGIEYTEEQARAFLDGYAPVITPLRSAGDVPWFANIDADNALEQDNISGVKMHMDELMRVPTVVAGAVLPDACPSDKRLGYIPVGGVVATKEAIHPGFHSADICCSMAISVFKDANPKYVLDAGMKLSHFGAGGRTRSYDMRPSDDLLSQFESNRYLSILTDLAIKHFGTQGDGNHFFYVGHLKSTGQVALVTHHGSRGPGAKLYSAGMDVADRYRRKHAPEVPTYNSWIPSESVEGRAYWDALQIIRTWTKKNHFAIHDSVAKYLNITVADRWWNEHNFVFRKTDGLFYHAKGATPAYPYFAPDTNGLTLIPLNMAEPILITKGLDAPNSLGFSPHGAGRNLSRTAFMKKNDYMTAEQMIAEQAPGIDVRYYSGFPDVSELPGAYKNAESVRSQIDKYKLAEVVDTVEPYGNLMAGDWQRNAPWRRKKKKPRDRNAEINDSLGEGENS